MYNILTPDQIRKTAPSVFSEGYHKNLSKSYRFYPTTRLIDDMAGEGYFVTQASEQRSRDPKAPAVRKHLLRFTHADYLERNMAKNDEMPQIIMTNSHNGMASYQLMAGVFRMVCINGMIVADSVIASVRIRHSGHLFNEVVDKSLEIAYSIPLLVEKIKEMKARILTDKEIREFAYEASKLRFPNGNLISPMEIVSPRRKEDAGRSLWTVFNVVQENALKGGLDLLPPDGSRRERSSSRALTGIDTSTKMNRGLWHLADQFTLDARPQLVEV